MIHITMVQDTIVFLMLIFGITIDEPMVICLVFYANQCNLLLKLPELPFKIQINYILIKHTIFILNKAKHKKTIPPNFVMQDFF